MALPARFKKSNDLYQPLADINVTPLVDVMLVLLIIMMIIAPMLQKGVDVKLPVAVNRADKPETQDQTVVAVKSAAGALTPLLVPSDPANPNSPAIPLSVAMMKDARGPYAAQLDPDSGQILNAESLRLRTAGVGTLRTGLPISNHQLGFVPPVPEIMNVCGRGRLSAALDTEGRTSVTSP